MSYTTETLGMTVVEEGEAADLRTVSDALDKIDAFAGDIATVEESPSVAAHDKGELLVYAGHLYKVTVAIAIGDSLTLGTNVTPANVGTELSTLRTDVDILRDSVPHIRVAETSLSYVGMSYYNETYQIVYVLPDGSARRLQMTPTNIKWAKRDGADGNYTELWSK